MLRTNIPLITRHDYAAMPEGPPYFQVIEGDLVRSASPTPRHQQILGVLLHRICTFLGKHPIGCVYPAPLDVYLSDTNVYQPDILYISAERESIIKEHAIEGAPDLVIEILSPSTAKYDQGSKLKIYARTGVQELWLVDPATKRIQIYDLPNDATVPAATHGPGSTFTSKILPGLKFQATAIFGAAPKAR